MTGRGSALTAIVLATLVASPARAQWLNYPTPGLPRLPDGKPDLAAAPARTADGKPDLSGIWIKDAGTLDYFYDLAKGLPPGGVVMTPWAQGVARQRESRNHIDDPLGYCAAPPGVPRINVSPPGAFKILQTPAVLALLYDLDTNPTFRQIHTDGRPLPKDPEPTWLGYSIGRWEGDEFVVTTAGFRDGGWLDTQRARPHSDALRVTERLRRRSIGRMDMAITIDDPKAFEKPWTVTVPFKLIPDSELLEGSCENHDKTIEHRRIDPAPPEPPSPR